MKVSFDMSRYDAAEAFRRAGERYKSERTKNGAFDIRLVGMVCRKGGSRRWPTVFSWIFEVAEVAK